MRCEKSLESRIKDIETGSPFRYKNSSATKTVAEAGTAFDHHYQSAYPWTEPATSRPVRYSGRLKRLDASFYRGQSYVHWTFCIQGRKTGWLSAEHQVELLAAMQDWLVRYHLCCYGYCLMPDHGHFLIIGLNDRSEQQAFVRELTRSWNQLLRPRQLSRQAYDTVLREKDREADAFSDLANYIWHNPVRAGLVADWRDWPHLGTLLPGYRSLDPRKAYFRDNFWQGYHDQAG